MGEARNPNNPSLIKRDRRTKKPLCEYVLLLLLPIPTSWPLWTRNKIHYHFTTHPTLNNTGPFHSVADE